MNRSHPAGIFLSEFLLKNALPYDVICVQEPPTKFIVTTREFSISLSLSGFSVLTFPQSTDRPRVAILAKSTSFISWRSTHRDIIGIRCGQLNIFSIYFHPELDNDPVLREFNTQLQYSPNCHNIICADVNCESPLLRPSESNRAFFQSALQKQNIQNIKDWTARHHLHVLNTDSPPTFIRGKSSSWLDISLSSNPDICYNWQVLPHENLSDHSFISFEIELHSSINSSPPSFWLFEKTDFVSFAAFLRAQLPPSRLLLNTVDIETFAENILQTLQNGIHLFTPQATSSRRRHSTWNSKAEFLRREIERLRKKCRRTHCPIAAQCLRTTPCSLRKTISSVRSKNFNRFLENLQQPTKFVRKLFNKHFAPRHPQEHERFLYGLEAAECIRDHFFPTSPEIVEPNSSTTYDATLITPYELRNCLKDMRKRAASGPDGIQIQHIIGLKDSIMEPLLLLYNSCLSFGFIPKCMKRAKVILINPLEQRRPP